MYQVYKIKKWKKMVDQLLNLFMQDDKRDIGLLWLSSGRKWQKVVQNAKITKFVMFINKKHIVRHQKHPWSTHILLKQSIPNNIYKYEHI